jgi:tetratricopeptide (TPR) repeat protein
MNAMTRLFEIAASAAADVDACERQLDVALALPEGTPTSDLAAAIDCALRLHRGVLRRAGGQYVPILLRERVRQKMFQALWRGAQSLRSSGMHEQAIAYLEKALELDPSAEHCRQALQRLHFALERNGAILKAFEQMRRSLGVALTV